MSSPALLQFDDTMDFSGGTLGRDASSSRQRLAQMLIAFVVASETTRGARRAVFDTPAPQDSNRHIAVSARLRSFYSAPFGKPISVA